MTLNIGTTVATVNIVLSTSRNAALNEPRMLQYTTLSIKLPQCKLSELKLEFFYKIRRSCLSLKTLRGPGTTLKPGLFNKI